MGIPRKGSRKIEVRGATYLWRLAGRSRIIGESPRCVHVTVQIDCERPGRVAQAALVSKNAAEPDPDEGGWHRASVVPQDIVTLIEAFLDAGWDSAERGPAFVLGNSVDLGMYETRP